jgi:methyl-accepting chemotaxis protein
VAFFRLAGSPALAMATGPAAATGFTERRGPNRAKNVTRPSFGAASKAKASAAAVPATPPATAPAASRAEAPAGARTGTDDWAEF